MVGGCGAAAAAVAAAVEALGSDGGAVEEEVSTESKDWWDHEESESWKDDDDDDLGTTMEVSTSLSDNNFLPKKSKMILVKRNKQETKKQKNVSKEGQLPKDSNNYDSIQIKKKYYYLTTNDVSRIKHNAINHWHFKNGSIAHGVCPINSITHQNTKMTIQRSKKCRGLRTGIHVNDATPTTNDEFFGCCHHGGAAVSFAAL